jgi:hypothetical protein
LSVEAGPNLCDAGSIGFLLGVFKAQTFNSELRDPYFVFPFFPKSDEEEDAKGDERNKEKEPAQDQVRSVRHIRRLVHKLKEKPPPRSQTDHSYKQKQIKWPEPMEWQRKLAARRGDTQFCQHREWFKV